MGLLHHDIFEFLNRFLEPLSQFERVLYLNRSWGKDVVIKDKKCHLCMNTLK